MSNQSVAILAFRLTGIWIAVRAVEHLTYSVNCLIYRNVPTYATGVTTPEGYYFAWGLCYACLSIILFVAAGIFIFGCKTMAEKLFPTVEDSSTKQLGLHAFVYSLAGIILFAIAFPRLVIALFRVFRSQTWSSVVFTTTALEPLLETIFGIALFFGSHGLLHVWTRLRYSGLRRQMGLCVHCGYDLAGNKTGRCPECGTPTGAFAEPVPSVPALSQEDSANSGEGVRA